MDLHHHLEVRDKKREEKCAEHKPDRTRAAKSKALAEYTAADREVKRSIRKDKRENIDNLASQAEEAAG